MGTQPTHLEYAGSESISKLMLIRSPSSLADGAIDLTETCFSAHPLTLQIAHWFHGVRCWEFLFESILQYFVWITELAAEIICPLWEVWYNETCPCRLLCLWVCKYHQKLSAVYGKKKDYWGYALQCASQKAAGNDADVFLTLKVDAPSLFSLWANKTA